MSGSALLTIILACAPQVAPSTVQSIIDVESSGNWLAIGVNRGGRLQRQPRDLAEAVAWARWLQNSGQNFDAGLMQINVTNWRQLGLTAENVFDPCTNVRAGATVLTENYVRATRTHGPGQRALQAALSQYNTGSTTRGFANGYVGKVTRAASKRAGVAVPVLAPSPLPPSPAPSAPALPSGVAPARAWNAPTAWGEASPSASPSPSPVQETNE